MTAGVANDTIGWVEIPLPELETDGVPVPFKLYGARFKSSSSDSEDFIHDPLNVFINAGLAGVDSTWRVTTLVVNHEKTLSGTHTYALGAAKQGGSGVIGTLVIKEPPPASETTGRPQRSRPSARPK